VYCEREVPCACRLHVYCRVRTNAEYPSTVGFRVLYRRSHGYYIFTTTHHNTTTKLRTLKQLHSDGTFPLSNEIKGSVLCDSGTVEHDEQEVT
jgi:hypothetical protein